MKIYTGRIPLPKKNNKIINPKTVYNRKKINKILKRKNINMENINEFVELENLDIRLMGIKKWDLAVEDTFIKNECSCFEELVEKNIIAAKSLIKLANELKMN